MVSLQGVTVLDDGYKRVKFKYKDTRYSLLLLPTVDVDNSINKFIKRIEDGFERNLSSSK